jgi:predicted phosphoribosyltransferase
LHVPLDLFLVRKLGVPGHEELAMGAIASGGVRVLNHELIRMAGITDDMIESVTRTEEQELVRREQAYRGTRPMMSVRDRTVILIDDGLATGSTMRAAVAALRHMGKTTVSAVVGKAGENSGPARLIVAVPTAASDTCEELKGEVDEIVCAATPEPFFAVGMWYENFTQTTDQEVRDLIDRAARDPSRPENR